VISEATAAVVSARLMSANWALKSEVMGAAVLAEHDEHFWQLLGVAVPDTVKVGPKGYIHGWIFVGAPGVGARVFHPQHGMGTVTKHDGTHATVKFDKTGATHTFEAREHTAKGRLTTRGDHAKTLADRVVKDPKDVGKLNDSELKDTDSEFGRRATALGKDGQVSRTHQKVKDEIARRGGASGGKVPAVDQEKEKAYKDLSAAAYRYNAATHVEGRNVSTFSDPDKQKEAIRLHTLARRAAPDAKSKKQHTDEINRHKNYLKQIENNQNIARYEKDSKQAREDIKQLERTNHGSDADHYDKLAEAHQRLADVERRRNTELGRPDDYTSQTVTNHEYLANAAHGEAAKVREEQAARKKAVIDRIPQAEKIVDEREAKARQSGKKADLESAIGGHEEISRHARSVGQDDVADKHDAAAAKLRADFPGGKRPSKPRAAKPVEGVPEDEKIKTPWGTMHPADMLISHPGAATFTAEGARNAVRELDRRGATPDGKDKISRARRQAAKELDQHEKWAKEAAKPGGYNDYHKAVADAKAADADAAAKGTADAHQAAADAHRKATTLAYTNDYNAASFHRQMSDLHQRSANQKHAEEAAKNPPKPPAAPKTPKPRTATPKAEPKEQTPDQLSAKAGRSGSRLDHIKAMIAHHQAGNSAKATKHHDAVKAIDASDEYKQEAEQHADAAERVKDPDLHKAAARSYRQAAEHMDDVPGTGGKKAAAELRAKADEHDNIAQKIIKATADYVHSFLHANRTGHKADKKGTADAHREAANAESEAASRALTGAQQRHHSREAARHAREATLIDAKTSVSAK
jgi:hypothetical protein